MTTVARHTRYGPFNTHDALKLAAMIGMTVGHVGAYLFPEYLWFRAIGRVATPAWFFLAGYTRPSALWSFDLVFLALFVLVTTGLTGVPVFPVNILFTIMICRVFADRLRRNDWLRDHPLQLWLAGFVWAVPAMLLFEYGTEALLYTAIGLMVRENMREIRHRMFCALTYVTFVFYQCLNYNFDLWQSLFVAAFTAAFTFWMWHFRLAPCVRKEGAGTRAIRWLTRHSLYYYAIHRPALQVAGMLLFPELHAHFRWW